MRVIGECGIVKWCASAETSPATEPAAEFILSGHQDYSRRQQETEGNTKMYESGQEEHPLLLPVYAG